ncbi:unnamed protein product [Pleuronectes platessa]|uniref:Uncharacterized protein n=1 Tax=Pleuronectes platessa TaxID=8262 RepID=A0A9N7UYT7_PLEPL|nr:unnamed protein product [Pleuronectes platessa]
MKAGKPSSCSLRSAPLLLRSSPALVPALVPGEQDHAPFCLVQEKEEKKTQHQGPIVLKEANTALFHVIYRGPGDKAASCEPPTPAATETTTASQREVRSNPNPAASRGARSSSSPFPAPAPNWTEGGCEWKEEPMGCSRWGGDAAVFTTAAGKAEEESPRQELEISGSPGANHLLPGSGSGSEWNG